MRYDKRETAYVFIPETWDKRTQAMGQFRLEYHDIEECSGRMEYFLYEIQYGIIGFHFKYCTTLYL